MRAIVLSYDQNVLYVDNLICQMNKLWNSTNFMFRIPYNEREPTFLARKYPSNRFEFVRTSVEIKPTVLEMIDDISDDEWILWCVDDKFLIDLKRRPAQDLYEWVLEHSHDAVRGVTFHRARKLARADAADTSDRIVVSTRVSLVRRRYRLATFFVPQFLRAGVVRKVFSCFPDHQFLPKEMDAFLGDVKVDKHWDFYMPEKNLAVFGESASLGIPTQTLRRSLKSNRIENYAKKTFSDKDIVIGKLHSLRSYIAHAHAFSWKKMKRRLKKAYGQKRSAGR